MDRHSPEEVALCNDNGHSNNSNSNNNNNNVNRKLATLPCTGDVFSRCPWSQTWGHVEAQKLISWALEAHM